MPENIRFEEKEAKCEIRFPGVTLKGQVLARNDVFLGILSVKIGAAAFAVYRVERTKTVAE